MRDAAPKTLCLDFDGVVHSYTSGWQGIAVISDPPVPGAIEYIFRAMSAGYGVAVHSARSRRWRGRSAMRAWLKKHAGNIWYDSPAGPGLEFVRFPKHKPQAAVYIDDRGYRFDGSWPDLDELMELVPRLEETTELKIPSVVGFYVCRHPKTGEVVGREYKINTQWVFVDVDQKAMPGIRLGRMPRPAGLEWNRKPHPRSGGALVNG